MTVEALKAITNLANEIHDNAVNHGFYEKTEAIMDELVVNDKPTAAEEVRMNFILAQFAKIASEVGEAVECIQKGRPVPELHEELADIIIRTLDLSAWIGAPIAVAIGEKMQKNALRPYLHGGRC